MQAGEGGPGDQSLNHMLEDYTMFPSSRDHLGEANSAQRNELHVCQMAEWPLIVMASS